MRICELETPQNRQILLGSSLKIKTTEIRERIDGEILNTINRKLIQINYDRFRNFKKEVNTIVMSPYLYKYLEYLVKHNRSLIAQCLSNDKKELFGLKIILRDDYEIDEIDLYRDITEEI